MNTASTSVLAYNDLVRTGTRLEQAQVILGVYQKGGDYTDREVESITGIRSNTVSARRAELLQDGEVEWAGNRVCRCSGRTVQSWRFKQEPEQVALFN